MNSPSTGLLILTFLLAAQPCAAHEASVIHSHQSGPWSNAATWKGEEVPGQGDRVLIREGHEILYDLESDEVIRGVCVSGVLSFARDRDTLLNVGLIRIEAGNAYAEEGFDCLHVPDAHGTHDARHADRADDAPPVGIQPALEIGTSNNPIPARHTARIRLHAVEGMDIKSCPAIICCGGRMDMHGAPLKRAWVKLTDSAAVGDTRIFLAEEVEGWKAGDQVVITGTARQRPFAGKITVSVAERPTSEVRRIRSLVPAGAPQARELNTAVILELDDPLAHPHQGGDYSGEVANLSRNVIIESADPDGARGHTMYHRHSSGSISHAEFRHLGKKGVLGRYPIHFHLVGDTMRGSSVIGASVWDSDNRWITLHGSRYLVVRDCVGYRSVGHGYFLEDGTEVFNVLDRNLAIQALDGDPLPEQVLPFDQNEGAGFWWANSLNAFTNNVAVECDQHGFRFEAEKTDQFDPVLSILQPDGDFERVDIRTLPFLRFEGNEAHCQRRFGLNLGGIRGLTFDDFYQEDDTKRRQANLLSIGGTVAGVGPDGGHPFHIRDFKVWDTHWAFHAGSPCVWVEGMDIFDSQYGLWRSTIDRHKYEGLTFQEIHSSAIFFPTGGHGPEIEIKDGAPSYPATNPVDDLPPVTIITHVGPLEGDKLLVSGTTADNNEVAQVLVNDRPAEPIRDNFAQWQIILEDRPGKTIPIIAHAEDATGNIERMPHRFTWESPQRPVPSIRQTSHGSESIDAVASGQDR